MNRDYTRDKLFAITQNHLIAYQVEEQIYRAAGITTHKYNALAFSIMINLDPESSVNRGSRFVLDKLMTHYKLLLFRNLYQARYGCEFGFEPPHESPKSLTSKTATAINNRNDAIVQDIQLRARIKIAYKEYKNLRCDKCGGNKIREKSKQYRASDEGTTYIFECVVCDRRIETRFAGS